MVPGMAPKPAAPMPAQPKKPQHMLVLGTGFVGRHVSERLLSQGWRVSGTCTSAAKKMELELLGMTASVFDATTSNLANLHALQDATHLLISIPPIPGVGDPYASLECGPDLASWLSLMQLLSSHADLQTTLTSGNLQWLCYLSSTSVYGDCGGAWVDEDHVVNPKSESSKLRYAAEQGWLDLVDELDLSAFILRLGGIYGPGRSALDTIAKRKSSSRRQKLRESKQYTARIHVADIYQAILASMSIKSTRKIYNVVDDDPAPRSEVFAFAQSLIEKRYPDLAADSAGSNSQDRIIAAEKRVAEVALHAAEPRLGARAPDAVRASLLLDTENDAGEARAVAVVRAGGGAEDLLAARAVGVSGERRGVVLGGDGADDLVGHPLRVPGLEHRPARDVDGDDGVKRPTVVMRAAAVGAEGVEAEQAETVPPASTASSSNSSGDNNARRTEDLQARWL
ncbi:hypothetical protein TRIUR3_22110 [Triticum urartu]|uniref:NAD-dependent epimerase/dehydratase domain-containing protein n=1 Tax=Triticum urartu TaxID=4572 RepID=M7YZ23_TRIUA|nr:hypothetical protein TRIUR3_22110 [Triticum urartu]